jgi:hypothetical protein
MTRAFVGLLGGETPLTFLGLDIVLGGMAALSVGRALAETWRPLRLALAYCLALAAAIRFLHFALFDAPLLSLQAYALDFIVAASFACLGFKLTRLRQMKRHYGWIDAERQRKRRERP